MKNNLLQVLLRRFFHEKVSPAEYTVLKSEVQKATDETMDSVLDILWEEQNLQVPVMDDTVKFRVLNNIRNQITDNRPSHNFSWVRIAAAILIPLLVSAASFYYFSESTTGKEMSLPYLQKEDKRHKYSFRMEPKSGLIRILILAILPYSIVITVR